MLESQSPQIGSMFLTTKKADVLVFSDGESQSPQIGSMFLTLMIYIITLVR